MVSEQKRISFIPKISHIVIGALVALGIGLGFVSQPTLAAGDGQQNQVTAAVKSQAVKIGQETGLPLPRFVSLKSDPVNLRVGPGRKYSIQWQYTKRGLPVEVIQEFEQWRRIRDSEGATGWVLHSLLSSHRAAIVAPWETPKIEIGNVIKAGLFDGKDHADQNASTVARLQPGLIVNVHNCNGTWCSAEAQSRSFFIKQESLWGVYQNEIIAE